MLMVYLTLAYWLEWWRLDFRLFGIIPTRFRTFWPKEGQSSHDQNDRNLCQSSCIQLKCSWWRVPAPQFSLTINDQVFCENTKLLPGKISIFSITLTALKILLYGALVHSKNKSKIESQITLNHKQLNGSTIRWLSSLPYICLYWLVYLLWNMIALLKCYTIE